jgi:hypothetical protein
MKRVTNGRYKEQVVRCQTSELRDERRPEACNTYYTLYTGSILSEENPWIIVIAGVFAKYSCISGEY